MESWRKYLSEQLDDGESDRQYYFPTFDPDESEQYARLSFDFATKEAKRMLSAGRFYPKYPVRFDFVELDNDEGDVLAEAYPVTDAGRGRAGTLEYHLVRFSTVYSTRVFKSAFAIIQKYWEGGVFNVDGEAEALLVLDSVVEIVGRLFLITTIHELLHCKTFEDDGASLGIDISKDNDLEYHLQKGETAIRAVEKHIAKQQRRFARKIIFQSLLPIFMQGERTNKKQIVSALMDLYEFFNEELTMVANFFDTRKHMLAVAKGTKSSTTRNFEMDTVTIYGGGAKRPRKAR